MPQRDTPDYWSIVQEFLFRHGKMGDGTPMTPTLARALMIGAWVGARFTLFDKTLGMGLAHHGNMLEEDPRYKALRDGFDIDFEEALRAIIEESVIDRGFTHMQVGDIKRISKSLTSADATAALDEILHIFGEGNDA